MTMQLLVCTIQDTVQLADTPPNMLHWCSGLSQGTKGLQGLTTK